MTDPDPDETTDLIKELSKAIHETIEEHCDEYGYYDFPAVIYTLDYHRFAYLRWASEFDWEDPTEFRIGDDEVLE